MGWQSGSIQENRLVSILRDKGSNVQSAASSPERRVRRSCSCGLRRLAGLGLSPGVDLGAGLGRLQFRQAPAVARLPCGDGVVLRIWGRELLSASSGVLPSASLLSPLVADSPGATLARGSEEWPLASAGSLRVG